MEIKDFDLYLTQTPSKRSLVGASDGASETPIDNAKSL